MIPAFDIAVGLEERGDLEAAVICYQTLMSDDVRAAVNLGVIHYNRKEFGLAADALRHAVKIDPKYSLAWFNLANSYQELFRTTEAQEAYETAIKISPRYADAHYNLALLLETQRQPRKAVKHWRAYLKLDPVGKFADHGRRAIRKTIKTDKLQIVWRRPAL